MASNSLTISILFLFCPCPIPQLGRNQNGPPRRNSQRNIPRSQPIPQIKPTLPHLPRLNKQHPSPAISNKPKLRRHQQTQQCPARGSNFQNSGCRAQCANGQTRRGNTQTWSCAACSHGVSRYHCWWRLCGHKW